MKTKLIDVEARSIGYPIAYKELELSGNKSEVLGACANVSFAASASLKG